MAQRYTRTIGDRSEMEVLFALSRAGYAVFVPFGENHRFESHRRQRRNALEGSGEDGTLERRRHRVSLLERALSQERYVSKNRNAVRTGKFGGLSHI